MHAPEHSLPETALCVAVVTMVLLLAATALTTSAPSKTVAPTIPSMPSALGAMKSTPALNARWGMAMAYDAADNYVLLFSGGGQPADTWTYSAGTWTKIATAEAPAARAHASMVFDPVDGYVLLFGGVAGGVTSSRYYNDTWTYSAGVWTNITLSAGPGPAPRMGASMDYDPAISGLILFGGYDGSSKVYYNDTWEFGDGHWTELTPADAPSPRMGASLAFDPTDNYALLFGGTGPNALTHTNVTFGDTWEFSGSNWAHLALNVNPPSRNLATMNYDPSDGYVVLFGGVMVSSTLNDTWAFQDGAWSQVVTPRSPPTRFAAGMAWDSASGYLVLFGGLNVPPHSPLMDDTWTFVGGHWSALENYTTCSVQFGEKGLAKKTIWYLNVAGTNYSTRSGSLTIDLPNGTWNFSVWAPSYLVSNIPHFIGWHFYTVGGGDVGFSVSFAKTSHLVTFSESGLPSGISWEATVNNVVERLGTDGGTDSLMWPGLANGTYSYVISPNAGWQQETLPYNGTLTVDGVPVTEPTLVYTTTEE